MQRGLRRRAQFQVVSWSGHSPSLLALVPVPGDTYEEEHDVEDGNQGEEQDEVEVVERDMVERHVVVAVVMSLSTPSVGGISC